MSSNHWNTGTRLCILLLALALAIGGYARWLALPPVSSPANAAPANAAPGRIQLSEYNLPAQPEFYSERDDNYMLGSYGG